MEILEMKLTGQTGTRPCICAGTGDWKIQRRHLRHAIEHGKAHSAPGPDGLPYAFWKSVPDLADEVLWDITVALAADNSTEMQDAAYRFESYTLNGSILACLPKTPNQRSPDGLPVYAPASTRPLSISNTDNRLISATIKYSWEPHLAKGVHPHQRGFLPGRSILQNIIDINEQALHVAFGSQAGAIIFFDFKAAFPSLSPDFLFHCLELRGMLLKPRNIIRSLYYNQCCSLSLKGKLYPGFAITAGIKQGCPLSPLLFTVATDILLRFLNHRRPAMGLRAFADDTAAVHPEIQQEAQKVMDIFKDYGRMSNLHLNLNKTVVIPLSTEPIKEWSRAFLPNCPSWNGVKIARWGRYLGYAVGPQGRIHNFTACEEKLDLRGKLWQVLPRGLHGACVAYNTYCASLPTYHVQLQDPTGTLLEAEKENITQMLLRAWVFLHTK